MKENLNQNPKYPEEWNGVIKKAINQFGMNMNEIISILDNAIARHIINDNSKLATIYNLLVASKGKGKPHASRFANDRFSEEITDRTKKGGRRTGIYRHKNKDTLRNENLGKANFLLRKGYLEQ